MRQGCPEITTYGDRVAANYMMLLPSWALALPLLCAAPKIWRFPMRHLTLLAAGAIAASLGGASTARACGCFTPPDPTVNVVQAGEQIVFAADGKQVVAHIRIQYSGDARDFGWLVPLPSVPKVGLSTEELFEKSQDRTQPRYRLRTVREACMGRSGTVSESSGGGGCGGLSGDSAGTWAPDTAGDSGMKEMMPNPAVVAEDSIGPYEYAVLKADNRTEMLAWLTKNHYYVPSTNSDVIAPYLHPGAYFLALKLKSGKTAGDIQPIALTYDSDLPMIPIVLTSVGAEENMGIQVFVLGRARAIPRNYHHTVLDDLALDWTGSINYQAMIVRAAREAPKHHTFVTEYAGPSTVAWDALAPAGRFGDPADLRRLTDAADYVEYLQKHGYPFKTTLYTLLERFLPPPKAVVEAGISKALFYANIRKYLGSWVAPGSDGGVPDGGVRIAFDPAALTGEIEARIIVPTRAAEKLFHDYPTLTRLYTTLSPVDMTEDPVFSFNPDLPEVSAIHGATLTFPCGGTAWLSAQGIEMTYPGGRAPSPLPSLPASLRIEILREEGQPMVLTDNAKLIDAALPPVDHTVQMADPNTGTKDSSSRPGCTCSVRSRRQLGFDFATLLLVAGALALTRRRRR
ncbi:MAG: DUF2330 domain-containing protein [Myxococcales bacterium]|nr:DUF2330 domain-containing protein [Myxococcales bacterium]